MSDEKKQKLKADIEERKRRLRALKLARAERNNGTAKKVASKASSSVLSSVDDILGGPAPARRGMPTLSIATVESVNIDPPEKVFYEVGTQCELGTKLEGSAEELEMQLQEEKVRLADKEKKMEAMIEALKEDRIKYDRMGEEALLSQPKEFSAPEQKQIMDTPEFQSFFTKSSRIIERALGNSYDVTVDYSQGDYQAKEDQKVEFKAEFRDDKKCSYRAVTSMNFSPKFPELLCVSYAGHDDPMSLDPDGTVLIWNLHLPNRPEYYFYCNSEVLSASFHPSNPQLVVGACRSGQVVIWDTRQKSSPFNRTSLSRGHTYPVYAMQCMPMAGGVGGANLHSILSVSTDGQACVWNDNNLHDPTAEVIFKPPGGSKDEITTTSYDFDGRDSGSIVLGSDEGMLYKARMFDKPGIFETVKAHEAPITNVAFHPSRRGQGSSDLFLTSSYDWTTKLWSNKTNKCLYTFESARDYVFDAKWSPMHPAVFAQGDGTGRLDVWNVNKATDVPVASVQVESPSKSGEKGAISRLAWTEDGKHIAVGMSTGTVHIMAVDESLVEADQDETTNFYDRMNKKTISTSA